MKRVIGIVALLSALALSPVSAQISPQPGCTTFSGNLVQDCGFEQPSLGNASAKVMAVGDGFPDQTTGPWFVQSDGNNGIGIGGSPAAQLTNDAAHGGWNANSGTQSIMLWQGFEIYQDIPTEPGHTYTISLAEGNQSPMWARISSELAVSFASDISTVGGPGVVLQTTWGGRAPAIPPFQRVSQQHV